MAGPGRIVPDVEEPEVGGNGTLFCMIVAGELWPNDPDTLLAEVSLDVGVIRLFPPDIE